MGIKFPVHLVAADYCTAGYAWQWLLGWEDIVRRTKRWVRGCKEGDVILEEISHFRGCQESQ